MENCFKKAGTWTKNTDGVYLMSTDTVNFSKFIKNEKLTPRIIRKDRNMSPKRRHWMIQL